MAHSRAVALATVVVAASLGGWRLGALHAPARVATVVQIIDGDTIVIDTGRARDTVRLLGVDAPETVHPRRPVECHGPEAAAFTRRRLLGQRVRLEDDLERRDRYGRRLAWVVLDGGASGGEAFSETLVRRGLARMLVIPPNRRHARRLLAAELEARRAGRGLWGACGDDAGGTDVV